MITEDRYTVMNLLNPQHMTRTAPGDGVTTGHDEVREGAASVAVTSASTTAASDRETVAADLQSMLAPTESGDAAIAREVYTELAERLAYGALWESSAEAMRLFMRIGREDRVEELALAYGEGDYLRNKHFRIATALAEAGATNTLLKIGHKLLNETPRAETAEGVEQDEKAKAKAELGVMNDALQYFVKAGTSAREELIRIGDAVNRMTGDTREVIKIYAAGGADDQLIQLAVNEFSTGAKFDCVRALEAVKSPLPEDIQAMLEGIMTSECRKSPFTALVAARRLGKKEKTLALAMEMEQNGSYEDAIKAYEAAGATKELLAMSKTVDEKDPHNGWSTRALEAATRILEKQKTA